MMVGNTWVIEVVGLSMVEGSMTGWAWARELERLWSSAGSIEVVAAGGAAVMAGGEMSCEETAAAAAAAAAISREAVEVSWTSLDVVVSATAGGLGSDVRTLVLVQRRPLKVVIESVGVAI